MKLILLGLLILAFPLFSEEKLPPKKKICFIVNPISGGTDKAAIVDLGLEQLDSTKFEIEVLYTQAPRHGAKLAREALERHADVIVAVGGDGSVNEIGQALIGSSAALAIIPTGSGNGLARHLQIPLNPPRRD